MWVLSVVNGVPRCPCFLKIKSELAPDDGNVEDRDARRVGPHVIDVSQIE
jgi:hypothetical protein